MIKRVSLLRRFHACLDLFQKMGLVAALEVSIINNIIDDLHAVLDRDLCLPAFVLDRSGSEWIVDYYACLDVRSF